MARRASLLTSLTSLSLLAVTLQLLILIGSMATSYLDNTIGTLSDFEQFKEFELSILYGRSDEGVSLEWFFVSRGDGYGVEYRTIELQGRPRILPVLVIGEDT